jgi:hypothetical protein
MKHFTLPARVWLTVSIFAIYIFASPVLTRHAGAYGVYESSSGSSFPAHQSLYYPKGFTLNEVHGMCGGNCPEKKLLPDLVLRHVFLREGGLAVTEIRQGHSYYVCFEVANIGTARSGAFRVRGGGLGIRYSPFQNHASLLPGKARKGCLTYPTTPPAGKYKLGIEVDSLHAVSELREDNNGATLPVKIVP